MAFFISGSETKTNQAAQVKLYHRNKQLQNLTSLKLQKFSSGQQAALFHIFVFRLMESPPPRLGEMPLGS